MAMARADASPVTPAPITATSICSMGYAIAPRDRRAAPGTPDLPGSDDLTSAPVADGGVVQVGEHQVVEDDRVGIHSVRDLHQRPGRRVGRSEYLGREVN